MTARQRRPLAAGAGPDHLRDRPDLGVLGRQAKRDSHLLADLEPGLRVEAETGRGHVDRVLVACRAVPAFHPDRERNREVSSGILRQASGFLRATNQRDRASHSSGSSRSARTRASSPSSRRPAVAWSGVDIGCSCERVDQGLPTVGEAGPHHPLESRQLARREHSASRRHAQKGGGHARRRIEAARRQVDGLAPATSPSAKSTASDP